MTISPRKTTALLAAAATVASSCLIWTAPAVAQPGPGRMAGGGCGQQALTGQAPDIMTYDSRSGTQVFVDQSQRTEVTAYNPRTRSAAHVAGDLGQHGTPEVCTVDGTPGGDAYSIRPVGDSAQITGFDGRTGQTWRMDGDGSLMREHDCFKLGLGLFAGNRGDMAVLGPTLAAGRDSAAVGVAVGDHVIGLGAQNGMIGAGVLKC